MEQVNNSVHFKTTLNPVLALYDGNSTANSMRDLRQTQKVYLTRNLKNCFKGELRLRKNQNLFCWK